MGKSNFSEQFIKLIKRTGYNLDFMRQTACLVVNLITVDSYVFLFNCTAAVPVSGSMTASLYTLHKCVGDLMLYLWLGCICRISQEYSSLFHHSYLVDFCVFTMVHRLSSGAILPFRNVPTITLHGTVN